MELIDKVSPEEGKEAKVVVNQTQGLCSSVEGCEPHLHEQGCGFNAQHH